MKEESPREEAIWTRGVSYSKLHNNLCPLFNYIRYKSDNLWHIYQSKSPCRETRALLSYREVGVERFELPTSSL